MCLLVIGLVFGSHLDGSLFLLLLIDGVLKDVLVV